MFKKMGIYLIVRGGTWLLRASMLALTYFSRLLYSATNFVILFTTMNYLWPVD
jgi:hypothetical protein